MITPLYSYEADTGRARVYHRITGATVCDVTGVNTYVGNLLSRMADEMYQAGVEHGRKAALEAVSENVKSLMESVT